MKELEYPESPEKPTTEELWGKQLTDRYGWLEDGTSEETVEWLDAQDALSTRFLETIPERAHYAERLGELLHVDTWGTPRRKGERHFFSRRHADQEKTVYYWRNVDDDEDHVLLDPNQMSADGTVSIGMVEPSPDGRLVAWSRKENNADEASLLIRDVESGQDLAYQIDGAKYAWPAWTPDGKGFYYTWLPPDPDVSVADRPGTAEIRFHQVDTNPDEDPLIHPATGDPRTFVGAHLSHCGRWLFVSIYHGWNASDVYILDREDEGGELRPFFTGQDAMAGVIEAIDDRIYLRTNLDAPHWKIVKASPEASGPEDWTDIVPERLDTVIQQAAYCGDKLVLVTLQDAHAGLEIHSLDSSGQRPFPLPGMGAISSVNGHPEHEEFFFGYQSFVEPPRIIRANVNNEDHHTWAKVELDIDPDGISVEQHWVESTDGASVSMFIVRPKAAQSPGRMLIYGYGGFMRSMLPEFRASIYPWLEKDGSYCVVNLRGGGEYGEEWHRAGMREYKQQTFDDLFVAAEYLVEEGITAPEKLAAYGGSNGGLLVGAALTQRPDLFGAIVCAVPLLDMIRYHRFGSGKTWISEYGSADESAEMFEAILAYSPYHQVSADMDYPPVLFQSADSDDRVDPMHARKMTAALQAVSDSPVLLKLERNAGHGGSDRVSATVQRVADLYAFISHMLQDDG